MSDTTDKTKPTKYPKKTQDVLVSERHAMDMKSMRQQLKERKMEQARRNVEALGKLLLNFDTGEVRTKVGEAFRVNLEVMNEKL